MLDRAVAIFDAVERGARTFTALVAATGFSRTTTHRMVKALEAHGLLELDGAEGYRLGPRFLRLAAAAADRERSLRDVAHPILERLAASSGESAQLYVRSGDQRLCVDSVESSSELRTIVEVGALLPLVAGSAGKVFLAHLPEPARDRLLEGYRPLTPEGPTRDRLLRDLTAVRRRGWAASAGEREPGVASVSAPVIAGDGGPIGSVSVSGPRVRLGRERVRRLAPLVKAAAREIEDSIGAGGSARA